MPVIKKIFTETSYTVDLYVDEKFEELRLDQFLMEYFPTFSRQEIKKHIKDKDVRITDRSFPHRPSTKVHYKEIISFVMNKTTHEDEYWNGEKLIHETSPEIIFEDENLLVISKPPYMATHPSGKHLFYCATVIYESKYNHTIHSIHRLDRETSGVLLLGKTPALAKLMREYFDGNKVKKAYFFIARVNKKVFKNQSSFTADERLSGDGKGLKRVYINHYPKGDVQGKVASTHFKIVHSEGEYILGLAFPKTGRQHQIRVHAMVHGLPLVGDKLYLGSYEMFQRFKEGVATENDHNHLEIPRHALHAIALNSPYENGHTFLSHIPKDLGNWVQENLSIPLPTLENDLKNHISEYFKS